MAIKFQPIKIKKRYITTLMRLVTLFFLGVGLFTFFWLDLDQYLSLQALQEHKELLSQWKKEYYYFSVLLFILAYWSLSAFSVPVGAWLSVAGGFMFGTFVGGFSSLIGASLGASVIFFIARYSVTDVFKKKCEKTIIKMESGFKKNQLSYMLVLRLIPLFPFWLVNLVPAFLNVSPRSYFIGTFLGMMPGAFVYASVGNGFGAVVDSQIELNMDIIYSPKILFPIMSLAILLLLPVVYKKFIEKLD